MATCGALPTSATDAEAYTKGELGWRGIKKRRAVEWEAERSTGTKEMDGGAVQRQRCVEETR